MRMKRLDSGWENEGMKEMGTSPRYDIHIHCIHVITNRIPVMASTVAELLLTVY